MYLLLRKTNKKTPLGHRTSAGSCPRRPWMGPRSRPHSRAQLGATPRPSNSHRQGCSEQIEWRCFGPTRTWLLGSVVSGFPSECFHRRRLLNHQYKTFRSNINSRRRKRWEAILSTRLSTHKDRTVRQAGGQAWELSAACTGAPGEWPGEGAGKGARQGRGRAGLQSTRAEEHGLLPPQEI